MKYLRKPLENVKLEIDLIFPKKTKSFLFSVLGDPRVNQNPAFLALGIIFYRFHNLLAAKIQQQRPQWEDEEVFQAARRRVIATLQVLIILPSWTK